MRAHGMPHATPHKTRAAPLNVLLALTIMMVFGAGFGQGYYEDVPDTHWAHDAVNELSDRGVLLGQPNGSFDGTHQLNRFELAVILHRFIQVQEEPNPEGTVPGIGTDKMTFDEVVKHVQDLEQRDDDLYMLMSDLIETRSVEAMTLSQRVNDLEQQIQDLRATIDTLTPEATPTTPQPETPTTSSPTATPNAHSTPGAFDAPDTPAPATPNP